MNGIKIKERRVGTVTLGIVLIVMGLMYFAHILFPVIELVYVIKCWPIILILLGVEILVCQFQSSAEKVDETGNIIESYRIKYDFPAILIMFLLTGFSMTMAILEWVYTNLGNHYFTW